MSLGVLMTGQLSWGFGNEGWRKGPWTHEEDNLLTEYVRLHGEGRWNSVAKVAGLRRNGKSCRLRWVNYLRPDLKKGQISPEEESLILDLQARWGNRWSSIARALPGRTDNEIKNYWRTHFKKKTKSSRGISEKANRHLLKSQQFHFQQEQQQTRQDFCNLGMENIMSLFKEGENSTVSPLSQGNQETLSTYQHTAEESGILDSILNDNNVPLSEALSDEMIFWDGFVELG